MSTTVHIAPTPATVGAMYDQLTGPFFEGLGGLHYGYWDDPAQDQTFEAATENLTNLVTERLSLSAGQRILDIGCGVGKPAEGIARAHDVHITGITVSNHQVELAQAQVGNGTQPGQVSFQFADVMNLPFADASFDAAYAHESLCHVHDKGAAFEHTARVLRPGGRLVVADIFLSGPINGADTEILARAGAAFQLSTVPTADEYRDLLQGAGLKVVEFTDIRHKVFHSYEVAEALLRKMGSSLGGEVEEKLHSCATALKELSSIKQLSYGLITTVRV